MRPTEPGTRAWQHAARAAIRRRLREHDKLPEQFFEALVRAGVYEPDPSFNAQFIRPAVENFGRRRVQTALLGFLRGGTNAERAGAVRAWYWTCMPWRHKAHAVGIMEPVDPAEWASLADLRAAWREAILREFVSNEDLAVRRFVLRELTLRNEDYYPADLRVLIGEAIRIGRTHTDEHIRHWFEIQFKA
ncbi:hypothetical protein BCD49_05065 [Pseudofrankia sp. EUN1h]|nr:hypothetical protein BCD49_05065 [Pseudofrankia sp. EUN1h]